MIRENMDMTTLSDLKVGDHLPELRFDPITRTTIGIYAGASGDFNPMHIDMDAARNAGFEDVFVHGMLPAAYLLRAVTAFALPHCIKEYKARFVGITQVHDRLQCTALVAEVGDDGGPRTLRLDLECKNEKGETKVIGHAVISL